MFDGRGSAQNPGRWNGPGVTVVYTPESRSLASLEVLVHTEDTRVLAAIKWATIPVRIDEPLIEIADNLPDDWRQLPTPPSTRELGSHWVTESRSAVLRVPSIVVGGEFNYLLNPRHPDFARLEIGSRFSRSGRSAGRTSARVDRVAFPVRNFCRQVPERLPSTPYSVGPKGMCAMSTQTVADLEDLYRAAIGPRRTDYYASKFLRFDQPDAPMISWNWSAFFPLISFFWFLYRRMYGYWAVFCLLIPLAISLCVEIAAAALHTPRVILILSIAALAYPYIVVPMFANALYYRYIKRRIETLRDRVPDPATQVAVLENAPHTSPIACVALAIIAIPLLGILAAIAIPAYQMYTVRAQVAQGLILAQPLERAIAEQYQLRHRWPVGLTDLGVSPSPSSRYVAAIDLDHGTLSIVYGNRASALIAGHTLSLRPTILDGRIDWACGYANIKGDDPISSAAGISRTDIDEKDLPVACHDSEWAASAEAMPPAPSLGAPEAPAEPAPKPAAAALAPNVSFDIADSMAVTQQVLRIRRQTVQQDIRSGERPSPPIFGRCTATIRMDAAGLPAADFPIACSDPRVTGILRQAISTTGLPHAQPGSTVLLRVNAPFPQS